MPSNFVERLEGEHLVDFYKSVFLGIGDGDDSGQDQMMRAYKVN